MKFLIFGRTVPVKVDPRLVESDVLGIYDPVRKEILIKPGLTGQLHLETVIHEFFHATWDRMGFNQTSVHSDLQELLSENLTIALIENFKVQYDGKLGKSCRPKPTKPKN